MRSADAVGAETARPIITAAEIRKPRTKRIEINLRDTSVTLNWSARNTMIPKVGDASATHTSARYQRKTG